MLASAGGRARLGCRLLGGRGASWPPAAAAGASSAGLNAENQTPELELGGGADWRPAQDELVSLIFWYKDDDPRPIYTLDARQVSLTASESPNLPKFGAPNSTPASANGTFLARNRHLLLAAKHYSTSERLHLETQSNFPTLELLIEEAETLDSGQYKCRVDFRRSRTLNQLIELLVEGESASRPTWKRHFRSS